MMIRYRLLLITASILLALFAAQTAFAGLPTDQLKAQIDLVIKVLENPVLKSAGKTKERRQAIRKIADEIFDWAESAKRALGRHWEERTEAQREEFVELYRGLLERAYIAQIERYSEETIEYAAESVDSDQATVRMTVTTRKGLEMPIDYRMLRRRDRWLVYDVGIDGVSLVSNYRSQFSKIIQTSSYPQLVKEMKAKQNEN